MKNLATSVAKKKNQRTIKISNGLPMAKVYKFQLVLKRFKYSINSFQTKRFKYQFFSNETIQAVHCRVLIRETRIYTKALRIT